MIIVSDGLGHIGKEFVAMLQLSGLPFKVLTTDRKKTRIELGKDIACVTGDMNRPATLKAAFGGADRLFLQAPFGPKMYEQLKEAIRVARISGITHICMVSGPDILMPPELKSSLGAQAWKAEEELIRSGTDFTIIRPAYMMQSLIEEQSDLIKTRGVLRGHILGQAPVPMVDARDIAGVVYAALCHSGHRGQTYTLTGTPTSFNAIADLLSSNTGDTIAYEGANGKRARIGSIRNGQSKWNLQLEKEWAGVFAAGGGAFSTDTIAELTGYPARTIDEFLTDHMEHFSYS